MLAGWPPQSSVEEAEEALPIDRRDSSGVKRDVRPNAQSLSERGVTVPISALHVVREVPTFLPKKPDVLHQTVAKCHLSPVLRLFPSWLDGRCDRSQDVARSLPVRAAHIPSRCNAVPVVCDEECSDREDQEGPEHYGSLLN